MYALNSDEGRALLAKFTGKQLVDTFNTLASTRGENPVKKFETLQVGRNRIVNLALIWELVITTEGQIIEPGKPFEDATIVEETVEEPTPPVVESLEAPPPVVENVSSPVEAPAVEPKKPVKRRTEPMPLMDDEAEQLNLPYGCCENIGWSIYVTGKMPRDGSKTSALVNLMLREEGMTEDQGNEATGWDGCSITAQRAAMTAGLRVFTHKGEDPEYIIFFARR